MPATNDNISKRLDELVKMRTVLLPTTWKNESTLMMSRWFDYRFTSPLALTLQFGRIYQEKLRAHIRRHDDVSKATKVKGTKIHVPQTRVEWFTALWNARKRADEFFLPYSDYIEFCFDFSSRRKRYWTMKPSQLHPSKANKDAWLDCFDRFYEDRIPHLIHRAGEMPQYRLENNLGLPAQIQFREIQLQILMDSPRIMSDKIAERVHAKRHIGLSSALELVNKDDQRKIEKDALHAFNDGAWPSEPVIKLSAPDLLPSCFGISEAINAEGSPCSTCPMANQCQTFGRNVMNAAERLTGSPSLAWEREKARNRKNTAASRLRTKDALY